MTILSVTLKMLPVLTLVRGTTEASTSHPRSRNMDEIGNRIKSRPNRKRNPSYAFEIPASVKRRYDYDYNPEYMTLSELMRSMRKNPYKNSTRKDSDIVSDSVTTHRIELETIEKISVECADFKSEKTIMDYEDTKTAPLDAPKSVWKRGGKLGLPKFYRSKQNHFRTQKISIPVTVKTKGADGEAVVKKGTAKIILFMVYSKGAWVCWVRSEQLAKDRQKKYVFSFRQFKLTTTETKMNDGTLKYKASGSIMLWFGNCEKLDFTSVEKTVSVEFQLGADEQLKK